MKLYSIETGQVKLDGGSMFGNAPKNLWQKWMVPDEENRITLACRALLVRLENGRNVLFEAGIGPYCDSKLRERFGIASEHKLLANLNGMGLKESDIHAVVLSHLHFDHAAGLLSSYDEGPQRLLFPQAKYYVSKQHWAYARHPHMRERASFIHHLHTLLEASGRLVLIDGAEHEDFPSCRFHLSDGHTIGLMMTELNLPMGPLVYVSDVIPGIPWVHLPITMGYDRFTALVVDEKQRLLEKLIKEKGMVFFSHDPNVACVAVAVDDKGKYSSRSLESPVLS